MEVQGKYGIRARVLKKSRSAITGAIFITFEIEYPRLILAELNTHRMLSKNSASSRAIPYAKMLQQLTARPVRFGEANPGMQDKGTDHSGIVLYEEEGYVRRRMRVHG
jgi:thymidylate synthase ThyX